MFTGGGRSRWRPDRRRRPRGRLDPLDLVDGLTRLVDRSLVIVDRDTMRYRMLETIRQYAREQLIAAGEASAVADRHFAVYAALAIESEEPTRGPAMVDWLDRLDAELDNLGARSSGGSRPSPGRRSGWRRPSFRYWAVRVMSQDNDARIVAAIEFARTRVVGQPDADPADRRWPPGCWARPRACGAMSGAANVALGWAEDAITLADASGDRAAQSSRLQDSAIATRVSGRSGSGARTCGRSSRKARTSPRRPASGGSSRCRRVRRRQPRELRSGRRRGAACGAASMRRDGPAARTRSAPRRWPRAGRSGGRGRPTPRSRPSGWRSSVSPSSATNGSCSRAAVTWPTPCDGAGGSRRRLRCTARRSAAGSTSVTRGRSRISWRTSRTSTSPRGRDQASGPAARGGRCDP